MLLDARTGLEHVTRDECLALLRAGEVGRVAFAVGGTAEIFPVNYVLDGESIVFRTDPGTKLSKGPRSRATFEIDSFDHDLRSGWSVIAYGRLDEVTTFESRTLEHVKSLGVHPWVGEKQHWMRLVPDRFSGRRLVVRPVDAGHR
jgi:nitroimidazol reductase NimA-like FMN-containing flavoprotein (pyridoxamine 5'-phosphate oxidase superfamily)